MALNASIKKLGFFKKSNLCYLCSKPQENMDSMSDNKVETSLKITNSETDGEPEKKSLPKSKTKKVALVGKKKHLRELQQFFQANPSTLPYNELVPSKILESRAIKHPRNLYLICPDIATNIAEHVYQRLEGNDQVIAQTNPGFGLITRALLDKGVPFIRLYESNLEYQEYIRNTFDEKIALYRKDFFSLHSYSFLDNMDHGQRVATLFEGIPIRSWTDGPVLTVVGTLSRSLYLRYLVKSIILQKDFVNHGRIDHFFITYGEIYKAFTATNKDSPLLYRSWSILYQMFFEVEVIEKYPRNFFLPWESAGKKMRKSTYDHKHLYLIKMTMKKDFPICASDFVPFFFFMTSLFKTGNKMIIPTCEKWVPGCGEDLILPKLKHEDYLEDMCVFSKFMELTPKQIISVYREISANPYYSSSPFIDMIENEWLKTETAETSLNDYHINESRKPSIK